MVEHDSGETATLESAERLEKARSRAAAARSAADRARAEAEQARRSAEEAAAESDDNPADDDPVTETTEHTAFGTASITILAVAAAAVIASVVVSVVLAFAHDRTVDRSEEEARIVRAANAFVVDLLSVDTTDVQGYSDRVSNGSTGAWHDEFTANRDAVLAAHAQGGQSTVGRVVQSGIEGRESDTAAVLVSASTAAAGPEALPGTSVRLRVNITEVDGQLKMSKVEVLR